MTQLSGDEAGQVARLKASDLFDICSAGKRLLLKPSGQTRPFFYQVAGVSLPFVAHLPCHLLLVAFLPFLVLRQENCPCPPPTRPAHVPPQFFLSHGHAALLGTQHTH